MQIAITLVLQRFKLELTPNHGEPGESLGFGLALKKLDLVLHNR